MTENNDFEFLIESLWILESTAGLCIFEEYYKDFRSEGIDTDLIASFLSALLIFADQAFADKIDHIQFFNRKIILKSSDFLLFIVAISADSAITDAEIKIIIDEIAQSFNSQFQGIFENGTWDHSTVRFESFSEELQRIVKKEPLKIKFLQTLDLDLSLSEIPESYQRYLDQIYSITLEKRNLGVTNKEISETMKVEPSAVTKMLEKLNRAGFISWDPQKIIKLTEKGKKIALQLSEIHSLLLVFFRKILKLKNAKVIEILACEIEHHILSHDVVKSLKEFLSEYIE